MNEVAGLSDVMRRRRKKSRASGAAYDNRAVESATVIAAARKRGRENVGRVLIRFPSVGT
jgi:hypothetical protein